MSRNVRDLRDIINISRLSVRQDEEEFNNFSSGEEEELCMKGKEDLDEYISHRPSSAMGLTSSFSTLSARPVTSSSKRPPSVVSGQRRVNLKAHSSKLDRPFTAPCHNVHTRNGIKHQKENKGRVTVPLLVDTDKLPFPSKYTPVPPINKKGGNIEKRNPQRKKAKEKINFDHLFEYLDSTIVNSWLEECNQNMQKLTDFVLTGNNFVEFASFFLSEIKFSDYCNLLDLEFSIIVDRLKYGLHAGYNISLVNDNDLQQLASAVLPEYPSYLKHDSKGTQYLLDIFLIISSSNKERYRALLKSMNCYTANKHFVQWLLAIRAHGLLSFLNGVLRFYLDFCQDGSVCCGGDQSVDSKSVYDYTDQSFESLYRRWVTWAISDHRLKVLDYFYKNKDIDLFAVRDDKKRNLLFLAIQAGNDEVMCYLCQLKKSLVNECGENGNTPLMYSVNKNDMKTAQFLIEMGADVNRWNEQADGATALHLAVLLDLQEMCQLLLDMGADKSVCMGVPAKTTPLEIAEQMGNDSLVDMLK